MRMGDLVTQLQQLLTEHRMSMKDAFKVHTALDLKPAPMWLPETEAAESIRLHLLQCLFGSDATENMHLQTNNDASLVLVWSATDPLTRAYHICQLKLDSGIAPGPLWDQLQQEGLLGLQHLLRIHPHCFIHLFTVRSRSEM